ncbi:MAG: hydantoinase B/oxoprolinase family protein [Hyphomicrobiaceae bacterium]
MSTKSAGPDDAGAKRPGTVDPFTMVVLRRRMEAIIREMVNALLKSGRSGVLNTAMDFSCSLTDARFQSVSVALGLPVHVGAIDLIPRKVAEKHGSTLAPGDCFANNSGYHGNTHCADFTLCVPVFYEGRVVFYTIARAHLGDMGFPIPSTYNPAARDVYEEGLMLPCIRVQRDGRDIEDVIDILKANIRAPEQFYGDYLACLAAVRTGEKRLKELCARFGTDLVERFIDEYQDYAELMAKDAISRLPKGRVTRSVRYDSELAQYPDGIPVTATLDVDPDAGRVVIDLTENIDNLPLGINMTESTVLACCRMGTLNVLGPDVPRSAGAFRRIEVRMRDGSAIGRPVFPAATSAATTNLCHLLASHIQALYADLVDGLGSAYGSVGLPGSCPVVSGRDPRRGNRPFVNQIIMGYWGGPAVAGHDGWLTYGSAASQGILWQSSVEIVEQQQPILIEELSIREDSGGAGASQGGPGSRVVFRPRFGPVRFAINAAAHDNPPEGMRGGLPGAPTRISRIAADGTRTDLGITIDVTLGPGERLLSEACGGGGYGTPAERPADRIAADIADGVLTPAHAAKVYPRQAREGSGR